ncbi:MAG: hypothetical protein N2035_09450 [Chthoniobacterales bacterium]|nr:hypothetical protein [Chthoniobacterales bacterium]
MLQLFAPSFDENPPQSSPLIFISSSIEQNRIPVRPTQQLESHCSQKIIDPAYHSKKKDEQGQYKIRIRLTLFAGEKTSKTHHPQTAKRNHRTKTM